MRASSVSQERSLGQIYTHANTNLHTDIEEYKDVLIKKSMKEVERQKFKELKEEENQKSYIRTTMEKLISFGSSYTCLFSFNLVILSLSYFSINLSIYHAVIPLKMHSQDKACIHTSIHTHIHSSQVAPKPHRRMEVHSA